MTTDKIRKDKNQNIQVFIRLRPLNQRERDIKSLGVVEVVNNREVVVRQSQQTSHTKKFTFDRAFAPNTSQLQVYQEVVSPLIEEVLSGYNCTVFAYGQTGTGKTHTMVGEHTGSDHHWQNDPLAGIIPRALSQLFDELRLTNTEYTVRVSYLELYNEELFDLLASSEDNSKLRIYEDVTRKGSNIVNGLEEITVYNKNEVYKIMSQGQERKRVASTLMNAQSSRSHTVFTIVVHMKENSPEGEELVKIGKLNLVDLAGSENISKAGSDNPAKKERARECVNINQSLLTLGRVITALVERHPHIPYRESKLTRILQESLGGRTKTSIIATISPGHKDLEETMSTLEYAHRAKNIQNKPEVNQKMTKKAILKEYAEEIDRLKRDLQASRDKNGVYLASETYAELTLKEEQQRKEIQELLLKKKAMEDERDRMEGVFSELNNTLETKNHELANTKDQLDSTKAELATTSKQLTLTKEECEEQQHLVSVHSSTEVTLSTQAKELLATADVATKHVECLHESVDKRKTVESTNLQITKTYCDQSAEQRDNMTAGLQQFTHVVTTALQTLQNTLDTYTNSSTETQEQNKQELENLVQTFVDIVNQMKSATSESHSLLVQSSSSQRSELQDTLMRHCASVQDVLQRFVAAVARAATDARDVDVKGHVASFVQQWYSGASARVTSLQNAHSKFESRATHTRVQTDDAHKRHRDMRRAHVEKRASKIQACMTEMQAESSRLQERLNTQLLDINAERNVTEHRLQAWVDEERRLFEEKIAKHVQIEKNLLETRLSIKMAEIEDQKKLLDDRMQRYKELYEIQLEADREELEMAEESLEQCVNWGQECVKDFKKYTKEFEEGTNAINVDMEVFSKNVVEVVEHLNNQMLQVLEQNKTHVEQEVSNVITENEGSCKQFVQAIDDALENIVDDTKRTMDQLVHNIETTNAAATDKLSHLAASTSQLITLSQTHQTQHKAHSDSTLSQVNDIHSQLNAVVETQAVVEARYLSQEYKVYSPTGKTPSRTDYRYPRRLAATSPHDRILARFRAMRRQNSEEDCIVIESDPERRQTSDSEGSVSEDSAVFAAPSPPVANLNRSSNNKIMKSTSEVDIYALRRQNSDQGKENTERSVSHKKPSKLPAPSSHKKPLVERNVN